LAVVTEQEINETTTEGLGERAANKQIEFVTAITLQLVEDIVNGI